MFYCICLEECGWISRQFAHIPRPKVVRNADALAGVRIWYNTPVNLKGAGPSKPQLLQFARGLQKPAMRPRSSGSSVTVWIVAGMDLRKTAP